ncbi:hypothetical protein [Streptomyces phaeochromogenes]|uniref:hypothetical protein n=1 Tax=Streptomyces phaeochromogenes TaxID=1923 RepID=UPI00371F5241
MSSLRTVLKSTVPTMGGQRDNGSDTESEPWPPSGRGPGRPDTVVLRDPGPDHPAGRRQQ